MEQIVDPFSRGGLPGSSSSHSPTGDEERADEPGKGFFRTFPQQKESAKLGSQSGSELLPESSPSTPAARRKEEMEVLFAVPKMVDVRCAGPASVGFGRENTVEFPQLQPVSWTRPLCATTDAHVRCPHAVHRLGWTSL